MKYFITIMLTVCCLASCAQSQKQSSLYITCDPVMNDQREELAEQFFEKLKIDELIELVKPCAEAGDAYYQFSLGAIFIDKTMMASFKKDVDYQQAFKWFTKAAEQGYEDAILILMDAYEQGYMGLEKDVDQYKYWKQKLNEVQKNMK